MILDVRVTVYTPQMGLLSDVTPSDIAGGKITYEATPSGCGAASIDLGLYWEDVISRGCWTGGNIVEISTADDALTASASVGATKLYVNSTALYDPALGEDAQQLYLYDSGSATVQYRLAVASIGSDVGGPYVTTSNTVQFNFPAGTLVGRRMYAGRIAGPRSLTAGWRKNQTVRMQGLSSRLSARQIASAPITNQDAGFAIYGVLSQFVSSWPELVVNSANFPSVGTTIGQMTISQTDVMSAISQILQAIPADLQAVRVGHDRRPRLMKLWTSSTNTYAYTRTIHQGVKSFEAVNVVAEDQNMAVHYNVVRVNGQTPTGQNSPVSAQVSDSASISSYNQTDSPVVSIPALQSVTDCANAAAGLLKQNSSPRSNYRFRVYVRNDPPVDNMPLGVAQGDVVRGTDYVTIDGFDGSAPNVSGLVKSAVTTIDLATGDRYQDVQIASIQPDWNAAMRERVNAATNAVLQQLISRQGLSQFVVESSAYPWTTTGLTVNVPTFEANFSATTNAIVGGNSFTLADNSTTYAWITTSNAWTLKVNDPSPVSGAILYAVFLTAGGSIIGGQAMGVVGIMSQTNVKRGIIGWRNMIGDTTGDSSTAVVDGGNKRFLHAAMSTQTQLDSGGSQQNLMPDAALQSVAYSNGTGTIASFWSLVNGNSGLHFAQAYTQADGANAIVASQGTNSSYYAKSPVFLLVPGNAYTISALLDTTNAVGTPQITINDPTIATGYAIYQVANISKRRMTFSFTAAAGVSKYVLLFALNNATINGDVWISQIQIEPGSVLTGWKPNLTDSNGFAASTIHNAQGSIIPSNAPSWSASGTASGGNVQTIITIPNWTYYRPDGSSLAITGSSFAISNVAANGATYYFTCYYDLSKNGSSTGHQFPYNSTTPASASDAIVCYQDGRVPITVSGQYTVPNGTGTTSGSRSAQSIRVQGG